MISSTSKIAGARSSKGKYEATSYSLSAPFSVENDNEHPTHDDGCSDDDVDNRPGVRTGAGPRAADGHGWRHGSRQRLHDANAGHDATDGRNDAAHGGADPRCPHDARADETDGRDDGTNGRHDEQAVGHEGWR